MAGTGVEKLVGTWEYVDGEHFDDYMKEIVRIPFLLFINFILISSQQDVGFALRQSAKLVKPKLTISQNGGQWTLRTESTLKTSSYNFTPGVEFDETRLDGEVVKVSLK